MLGVLPKSQGIAEKKMTSQTQDHLFLVIVFSLYLFFYSFLSSLCFFPIQQSFSFIIQFDSQSYHFSLVSLERL